jgi:hypothetical protein
MKTPNMSSSAHREVGLVALLFSSMVFLQGSGCGGWFTDFGGTIEIDASLSVPDGTPIYLRLQDHDGDPRSDATQPPDPGNVIALRQSCGAATVNAYRSGVDRYAFALCGLAFAREDFRVLVSAFVDLNGNGTLDAGEPLGQVQGVIDARDLEEVRSLQISITSRFQGLQ